MKQIRSLHRVEETIVSTGGSGDNWHSTWAANDRLYTSLCDGRGWETMRGHNGKHYNTRVYAVDGDAPSISFEHLSSYPELLVGDSIMEQSRYYGFGIIAVGDCIYHYLSTPNHPFALPKPKFFGAKLVFSPDAGESWLNQDGTPLTWEHWDDRSRDNMIFFNETNSAFSLLTALQMGKGYEQNRDGFLYIYAPGGNEEGTMNQLVLCRVAKEQVLDRSAYEFFVEHTPDDGAVWSTDIEKRGVVHTFPPGWVNTKIHPYAWHPSVVYFAPAELYLMANWGMGCTSDGMWFGKPSYLGFWTSEHPWGPWKLVHEETSWMPAGDPAARAYQPQIMPKWIAPDGSYFWLAYTDFHTVGDERPYYCFNMQKVEVRY